MAGVDEVVKQYRAERDRFLKVGPRLAKMAKKAMVSAFHLYMLVGGLRATSLVTTITFRDQIFSKVYESA